LGKTLQILTDLGYVAEKNLVLRNNFIHRATLDQLCAPIGKHLIACAVRIAALGQRRMALLLTVAASKPESYREYVMRAAQPPSEELARALDAAGAPAAVGHAALEPLIDANRKFLDAGTGDARLAPPSTDARVAVPLLTQLVRDWSDASARGACYVPLVAALREPLAAATGPTRVLVPGAGLGRLAYEIAAAVHEVEVVALDPDAQALMLAGRILAGEAGEEASCDGAAAPDACAASGDGATLYPSLHVTNNWAASGDRLQGVRVPDLPAEALRAVQRRSNITLAVGRFPDDLVSADDEFAASAAGVAGRGFDAVATSYFLDVATDLPRALRAISQLLRASGGTWANCGPLAFPAEHGAMGGDVPFALSWAQVRALVTAAGFEFLAERQVECTYTQLPWQLERQQRSCFFFVARPRPWAFPGAADWSRVTVTREAKASREA
jgi:SAM-dependent methyltransferase